MAGEYFYEEMKMYFDIKNAQLNLENYITQLSKQDLSYLQIIPPSWMQEEQYSAYLKQIHLLAHLYKEGRIVMAHIVQANRMLFSDDNPNSCPAEIVYDVKGESSIDELAEIAHKLFQLKHTTPDDPELRKYAEHLTNENTQLFNNVPKVLTDKDLVTTTMFIWRPHLPNGVLSLGYFPILISDNCQGIATVLPTRFWQDSELYQDWIAYNDMDMSNAFLQLDPKGVIWNEYKKYVKPAVFDFKIVDKPQSKHAVVSERSLEFLRLCIDAVYLDYQEQMNHQSVWLKLKSWFWGG